MAKPFSHNFFRNINKTGFLNSKFYSNYLNTNINTLITKSIFLNTTYIKAILHIVNRNSSTNLRRLTCLTSIKTCLSEEDSIQLDVISSINKEMYLSKLGSWINQMMTILKASSEVSRSQELRLIVLVNSNFF